jgi:hypothetical protein
MSTVSNPPTLVLGDIHDQIDLADRAIAKFSARCARVVMLGDYFDSWGRGDGAEKMRATCRWLRQSSEDPSRIHLIGNHDFSYLLNSHPQAWCPGWTVEKQNAFDAEMTGVSIGSFRIACQAGPWLLSHAGFHRDDLDRMGSLGLIGKIERDFLSASTGRRSWLFDNGPTRGGSDEHGGPLWLDWSREFLPTAGIDQIVGHTPSRGVVRWKCLTAAGTHRAYELASPATSFLGRPLPQAGPEWISVNCCLDTGLVLAGIIEGGRLEIVEV